MLFLKYENFDHLFLDINKKIIEEPEQYVEIMDSNQVYLPFTILESDSSQCTINLSKLCYTATKIKALSRTYINKDNLKKFKEHLRECKGTSITYYFNNVKEKQGTTGNNGPCIISIVFTRNSRKDKVFNEANIYYRTTELNRRFYADLVLFNLFIKELPEDLIKIEKFRIILPKGFIHTQNILFNLDLFNVDLSIDNPVTKELNNRLKRLNDGELYSYKCVNRIQRKLRGELVYPEVKLEDLKL